MCIKALCLETDYFLTLECDCADMVELNEIVNDVLTEMYDNATPSLDFSDVRENPEEYPDDFYLNYELEKEQKEEILQKYLSEYKLTDAEESAVRIECMLYLGPTSPN